MATGVPGFLYKTYEIFNTPEYHEWCCWGPQGDTIIIKKIDQFSKNILPKYFKHANFQSFVRQLNMYDFHKTIQDPYHSEFKHQFFKKNHPEMLSLIKRKAHVRNELKKKSLEDTENEDDMVESQSSTPIDDLSNAAVATLLSSSNKEYRNDAAISKDLKLQQTLSESLTKKLEKMKTQHSKLSNENSFLRQALEDSHYQQVQINERMEKVCRALFSMFGGNPAFALPSNSSVKRLLRGTDNFPIVDVLKGGESVAGHEHAMIKKEPADSSMGRSLEGTALSRMTSFDDMIKSSNLHYDDGGALKTKHSLSMAYDDPIPDDEAAETAAAIVTLSSLDSLANAAAFVDQENALSLKRQHSVSMTSTDVDSVYSYSESSSKKIKTEKFPSSPHHIINSLQQNQENAFFRLDSLEHAVASLLEGNIEISKMK